MIDAYWFLDDSILNENTPPYTVLSAIKYANIPEVKANGIPQPPVMI